MDEAVRQSARDVGCLPDDFRKKDNVVVSPFSAGNGAKKCLDHPVPCLLISFGGNIVAGADEQCGQAVREYITKFEGWRCFEPPALHWLDMRLAPMGIQTCLVSESLLLKKLPDSEPACPYEVRMLGAADFAGLYTPHWSNALCEQRRNLDVLGAGAYDNGQLVGLAACSADCRNMWQIGVDVLASHRGRGVATALTSILADKILERGKIPFYSCGWSNLASARTALASGFAPAWIELACKSTREVEKMNLQAAGQI